MLLELEIENFALIDRLQLEFQAGLNVLTGETGAGKSIVLDALGFLLGSSPRDLGAKNAQKASRVAGRFQNNPEAEGWLREQGYEVEDELMIVRELSPAGRSSCRINARMCTLTQLKELAQMVVEIHGQHQATSLQRPSKHLELLDRLAGEEHLETLRLYREHYRRQQQLAQELEELAARERDRHREVEWLRHEIQEIQAADPQAGELTELDTQIRRLQSAEELHGKSSQALELENGAEESLGQAQRLLSSLLRHDPSLQPLTERFQEAQILLRECHLELASYLDELSSDPGQLDSLVARQELLRGLERKYGTDVLEFLAKEKARLAQLEGSEERREALQKELAEAQAKAGALSERLSGRRREVARQLEELTAQELTELNLSAMRFVVQHGTGEAGPAGVDQMEYYLSANPGVPPRPLAKVASGGELSRIMLALISLLAAFDPYPTLIFDEIDAGLGGRAAEAVARKLARLASSRQVLCVTHVAVIAAAANHHLRVQKQTDGQTTQVHVETLPPKARQEEVARMLSGDASPEAARKLAKELLAKVRG